MADASASRERRILNRLTTIKLANQILERYGDLNSRQRSLVYTALGACDALVSDILSDLDARPQASSPDRPDDTAPVSPGPPDRPATATTPAEVDVLVISPDRSAREQLGSGLASRGYAVQPADRIDPTIERLLARRPRLVVLSPDPDVGQAEIEAQVRRVLSIAPRAAVLVCLTRDQAPGAAQGERVAILRGPLDPTRLLTRARDLYPGGPTSRVSAQRDDMP